MIDVNYSKTYVNQHGYIVRRTYKQGANGKQNGYRGRTGSKSHILITEEIVGLLNPLAHTPGSYGANWLREMKARGNSSRGFGSYAVRSRPVYYSVRGLCASNGQNTGVVSGELNPADVTCARCRKYLEG